MKIYLETLEIRHDHPPLACTLVKLLTQNCALVNVEPKIPKETYKSVKNDFPNDISQLILQEYNVGFIISTIAILMGFSVLVNVYCIKDNVHITDAHLLPSDKMVLVDKGIVHAYKKADKHDPVTAWPWK